MEDYREELDYFVLLVRQYVTLLKNAQGMRPHDVLVHCARLLPQLYATALAFPQVEPDTIEAIPSVPAPSLPSFGKFELYSEVYDPYVADAPVMGSLAGDLSEIYEELAGALQEFDAGRTGNAVWSWRFSVRGHCGDHMVDALRAIHRAVNTEMPSDYDPAKNP